MNEEEYNLLVQYISSSSKCEARRYPEGCTKSEKRDLRKKCKVFEVDENGVLFHLRSTGVKAKVVLGDLEKERVLRQFHSNEVGGGHFGINNTFIKIKERFWWKKMYADVASYCQKCDKCQRCNPQNTRFVAELHPIPVASTLFNRWGVDLIGPLQLTANNMRYIIVATEYLTKWPEISAIPDKCSATIAEFILSLIYRYGLMEIILHDQGSEFKGINSVLCDRLGITRAVASAYHPQVSYYSLITPFYLSFQILLLFISDFLLLRFFLMEINWKTSEMKSTKYEIQLIVFQIVVKHYNCNYGNPGYYGHLIHGHPLSTEWVSILPGVPILGIRVSRIHFLKYPLLWISFY